MSDPSVATKTCPECGSENVADAITCGNADCTYIFAGDEGSIAAAPPMLEVEEPAPVFEAPVIEPVMAPAPPMAESATPFMAAAEPPPIPAAPEYTAPVIQPPPAPMPPAGSAPSTYAPSSMTTPPPYTPPPPMETRLGGSGKSKVTAGILGILLGALGIHHFYLGNTKMGVFFLVASVVSVFCTAGIGTAVMSVLGLVQGILYLVATDEDFERKYVQEQKFF